MGAYIKKDIAREYLHKACECSGGNGGLMLKIRFDEEPGADVRENVHGEWQVYYDDDSPQDGIWKCSICGYIRLVDDISPTDFCPKCGADMRKEVEE